MNLSRPDSVSVATIRQAWHTARHPSCSVHSTVVSVVSFLQRSHVSIILLSPILCFGALYIEHTIVF